MLPNETNRSVELDQSRAYPLMDCLGSGSRSSIHRRDLPELPKPRVLMWCLCIAIFAGLKWMTCSG